MVGRGSDTNLSRPICDTILKRLEGPTKDRTAYWNAFARWISLHQHYIIDRRHQEQCSRHKTIGTIPRYPRDPKKILVKFEERKVKTSTSGDLTRATKGLRSKKNPTLRYI